MILRLMLNLPAEEITELLTKLYEMVQEGLIPFAHYLDVCIQLGRCIAA